MVMGLLGVRARAEVDLTQSDCISQEETARSILRFFLESPGQVESFAGIARWRLLEEQVRRSVKRTEEALQWLVSQEFLLPDTVGSRPVYRLNPNKIEEAKRLVEVGEGEGTGE